MLLSVSESVDSISRDGLDTPIIICNTIQKINIKKT